MVNASQVRARMADWLDGRIAFAEFEDWLLAETWNIHKAADADAENLVDEIELRISEYSGGHLSADQLKEQLKALASAAVLSKI